jgi:hypothetical protein
LECDGTGSMEGEGRLECTRAYKAFSNPGILSKECGDPG